jgi:hypothetical protein
VKENTVSIAGIDISFLYDEEQSEPGVGDITNQGKENGGIRFHVHHGPLPDMDLTETIFDSGQAWALFKSDNKYVLQNNTLRPDSSPDIFIVLNSDLRSGDIIIDRDPAHTTDLSNPLGWPLNQILMIYLLSKDRGILFHACGIDDRGNGILFMGNSGHGKSTMGKLWLENQCSILNDDRIVVREKDDQFWMYGTPWHGDLTEWSLKGLPIKKIFFLNPGGKNNAIRKNGAEAVSMLIARSFPPFWDQKSMTYTMNFCDRLVSKIPCHELSFEPNSRIIDFVRGIPLEPRDDGK